MRRLRPIHVFGVFVLLLVALAASPAYAAREGDDTPARRGLQQGGSEDGVTPKPIADKVVLQGVQHDWQKWNNCGPTTTSMALSYYGVDIPQLTIASVLKPNPQDVNVSPDQIANYVRSQGLQAQVRVNGNRDILMAFLSNGIPVIVEQWIPEYEGMGHYRLAIGYDKANGTIMFDDSFYGPNRTWSFDEFEGHWMEFNINRIYIPIYRRNQAPLVRAILGPDADDDQMWARAEAGARANLEAFSDDGKVWFGLGDALLNEGRTYEALQAYERAHSLGLPWRYYWYQFGHFEALAQMGRWQRLLDLTDTVLAKAPMHEEMYFYRGLAYQGLGDTASARDAFNQALANNRNFDRARVALRSLD
ncbi:MAG: C39 family peptidase [Anaerolineae bacterium]